MPTDIQAALTRKLGPLPVWVWGLGVAGGYVVGKRFLSGPTTEPGATEDSAYSSDLSATDVLGSGYSFPSSGPDTGDQGGGISPGSDYSVPESAPMGSFIPTTGPGIFFVPGSDPIYIPGPDVGGFGTNQPEDGVNETAGPVQKTALVTAPKKATNSAKKVATKPFCFEFYGRKWGKSYPGSVAFAKELARHGVTKKAWARKHPDAAKCLGVYKAWAA